MGRSNPYRRGQRESDYYVKNVHYTKTDMDHETISDENATATAHVTEDRTTGGIRVHVMTGAGPPTKDIHRALMTTHGRIITPPTNSCWKFTVEWKLLRIVGGMLKRQSDRIWKQYWASQTVSGSAGRSSTCHTRGNYGGEQSRGDLLVHCARV